MNNPLAKLSENRAGIYFHEFLTAIGCQSVEQFNDVCPMLGICACANCWRKVVCWLIPAETQNQPGFPFCFECFWDFFNAQLAKAFNDTDLVAECEKRFDDRAKLYAKSRLVD